MTVEQGIESGRRHLAEGRLGDAERAFRAVAKAHPANLDALMLLALTLAQLKRDAESDEVIERALKIGAGSAVVLANLAFVRANQAKWDQAVVAIDSAIALQPDSRELLNAKAGILGAAGRMTEAVECHRRIVDLDPAFAPAWTALGAAQFAAGRLDKALGSFERAAALLPSDPGAKFNLARALGEVGQRERALEVIGEALGAQPGYADAWNLRGVILQSLSRVREAIESYRKAVAARPDFAVACNNLGVAYQNERELDPAIAAYRKAIDLQPHYADAYGNLAQALSQAGELDAALETYRVARDKAADRRTMSAMLVFLHTNPDFDARAILREHQWWEQTYARPLYEQIGFHTNDRAPRRRLRVAYLSADLNHHPQGRFMLPVLEHHDRRQFEIVCYQDSGLSDAMTDRLKHRADQWYETVGLGDADLARKIRDDRIDVLVDLTMHAKGSRLLALARKPAPVQIAYLAYCSTTGVRTIDWRISDPYLDAPGGDESVYSEKTARVSASYWVYSPPEEAPEVSAPPSELNRYITFGCMNNFFKVSRVAIDMWAELLRLLPESELLIHCHEGSHRQRFIERLGVDLSRVEFVGYQRAGDYFGTYSRIDISLDPFPFGGGTTTCDSLWMGVPVVTRAGDTAVSRGGASILSNVGVSDLIARDGGDYVRIASELASDRRRRAELRATMRDRMRVSPVMDGARLAGDLEGIYREAWARWCGVNA